MFQNYKARSVEANAFRARAKLNAIQQEREKGEIVCYRCGDSGHLSHSCRNALVCFVCGRLGHRSQNCRSITSLPLSQLSFVSPVAMEKANKLPLMVFRSNQINCQFSETLQNSLVLKDELGVSALYIQSHLQRAFSIPGWSWIARSIPKKMYLLEPPVRSFLRVTL